MIVALLIWVPVAIGAGLLLGRLLAGAEAIDRAHRLQPETLPDPELLRIPDRLFP